MSSNLLREKQGWIAITAVYLEGLPFGGELQEFCDQLGGGVNLCPEPLILCVIDLPWRGIQLLLHDVFCKLDALGCRSFALLGLNNSFSPIIFKPIAFSICRCGFACLPVQVLSIIWAMKCYKFRHQVRSSNSQNSFSSHAFSG